MAEPPPESSHTPPGSSLNEATRPQGHSMEDHEQSVTRKRPRLDSGSGAGAFHSIDSAAAPASDMDLTPESRPANKMTINVKDTPAEMADESLDPAQNPPTPPSSSPHPDADAPHDNVISISSSPAQSPEIEVAEPEYIGQDSNTSNWKTLDEVMRDQADAEVVEVHDQSLSLRDMFPKLRDHLSPWENLHRMCAMIEKCNPRDGEALTAIKEWMDECVQNLDRLTPEAYAEDTDFWDSVPCIVEYVLRRTQEIEIEHPDGPWAGMEEFLVAFVHLSMHMIHLDTVIMRQLTSEPEIQSTESLSHRYLSILSFIFQGPSIPFYRSLQKVNETKWLSLSAQVRQKATAQPINIVKIVADFTGPMLSLTPRCPHFAPMAPAILMLANNLIGISPDKRLDMVDEASLTQTFSELIIIYDMIRAIDEKYQEWITKKSPWASSELSEQLLRQIFRGYTLLFQWNPGFVTLLAKDLSIELSDDENTECNALIVTWAWKFGVLKKLIMEGRMELRVHGVETMQSDLVSIWRQHSSESGGMTLSFVNHLVRFIKDSKLVDYLVGVDSHPQLICRSSNIVGFLIIASAYTDVETDIIWKTVTESQDRRIVTEVLSMLVRTFLMHTAASPALLYICQKVLELPLDRFDPRTIDFCDNLFTRLMDKPIDLSQDDQVDAMPLRLCVRLIRDSTSAEDLPVDQKTQLQSFGSKQLQKFIRIGISDADRVDMYERCIQDIAQMNQFTVGSIQVLGALIPSHDVHEMLKLATDFDLTRLVIVDLLHTVNDRHIDFSESFAQHGLIARVAMLFRLVDVAPETITPELGSSLWNEILLSSNLGYYGHNIVWSMMVNALKRSSKPNPFLERCIHEYLPALGPRNFSSDVFAFAKAAIGYEVRFTPPPRAEENQVVTIPGMERIWTFILTAPPESIETEAINFAIEVYLDYHIIRNSPRSAVEATHIAIVDRCVDQLKSAAAALKTRESTRTHGDATDPERPDSGHQRDELKFRRSLLFLRQLLNGLRSRPQYSPPRGPPPRLPARPLKGNPVDISWQSFNGSTSSQIQSLRIGELSTATELVEMLTQLTGFSKFSAICGGQRIELLENPDALVRDMKARSGLLILRKTPDPQGAVPDNRRRSPTPVDSEILKHFDEIYDLLALEDDLAREIYDFLAVFPPQERVMALAKSEDKNEKDLFPFQKPFVALHSFSALQICLREEALETSPKQSLVSHAIRILVAFLMSDEVSGDLPREPLTINLAVSAVECLLTALAAYRPENGSSVLFENPGPFAKRLMEVIERARGAIPTFTTFLPTQKVICLSFSVLIEGSMHDDKFWDAVKQQQSSFDRLIGALLLEETRQPIRNDVSERIKTICSPSKSSKKSESAVSEGSQGQSAESPARIDMLATIWNVLAQVIPRTPKYASQSAEFFKVALWVFRSVTEKSPRDVMFSHYLKDWCEVMLSHRTAEFIGREPVDHLISGFASLLEVCLQLADDANVDLETFDVAERILTTYLFPDLTPDSDGSAVVQIEPKCPVMHSETRKKLYNIVNLLCKRHEGNLSQVMSILHELVPRDYSYGPNAAWDRYKMIRTREGYAGLKNLSNTCYLNSLMTQLFMNVEFRDFMLQLNVVDPSSSQKLLGETQRLFAWMQDTWTKSVDPQDFVESIRTYDNEAIDVTVQMDVDEFYNLLFDRWEAQVVDPKDKQKFRTFYGGQLVQQIKSQECSHISERLEPFSAIQCDIKGKASLEESLQAYVEGEIMQGDNKYSCTGCGRHVDAVKRACLKDVPDNLIFHLKRFDFDMMSMMRSKINDEFRFPDRIDMAPYKVEHLSDPESPVEPDVFELVGVLVHTGTAESGHYYSYTRERPAAGVSSWVEFNDSDVSRFDPSTIPDNCFGGQGDMHGIGGSHLNRAWNAYMLFYQRVSTMEQARETYKPLKRDCPVRLPVPASIGNTITMDNELVIRSFCLLDPQYICFVQLLLSRLQAVRPASLRNSQLEMMAIDVGMDTFEQLVARTMEHVGVDSVFTELYKLMGRSPETASRAIKWVTERETSIRNFVIKTPTEEVRQKGIMLIMGPVKKLQAFLTNPDMTDAERKHWKADLLSAVEQIVDMLDNTWPLLQTCSRAWDDYFEFFVRIAQIGPEAISMMLETSMLLRCIEIVWIGPDDQKGLRGSYLSYSRLLEKGRQFSYMKMLELCSILFDKIDFALRPIPGTKDRREMTADGKFPLSVTEAKLVRSLDNDGALPFLTRILHQDGFSQVEAGRKIFATFVAAEPEPGYLVPIIKTLEGGLRLSPADLSVPFLHAAVLFCENCPYQAEIVNLVAFVAKGIESINNSAGGEHLDFFANLCTLTNKRLGLKPEWFTVNVQRMIPDFAPTLLIDTDRDVRQGTVTVLNTLLFSNVNDEITEETRDRCYQICRVLMQACVDKIRLVLLNGHVRSVESRLVYPIASTVNHCLETYFDDGEEDQKIVQAANNVLALLEEITVDVPDEFVSESDMPSPEEWEATSALASDSEMGLAGSP